MLDLGLQLKRNELCLVGREAGHETIDEAGLYVRDTRFLSRFAIGFLGAPLQLLDLQLPSDDRAVIWRANPGRDDTGLAPQTLLIRQEITLDTTLVVTITVENFGREPLAGPLEIELAADFRDMFDVRGMTPKERAQLRPAEPTRAGADLSARSVDGQVIETRITASPVANAEPLNADVESAMRLIWHVDLAHNASTTIELRIAPQPIGAPLRAPSTEDAGSEFAPRVRAMSPSPVFEAFIARCDADLALLQTTFPEGNVPAAGIPWYIAPFGRDSLIVALQTMHAYPDRVASTLRVLASLQATDEDPWREAQPGKILHEMRYGDMARTGQVPHTPYYGSVDSTPLFVMTFAQHYLWHRDDALYDDLLDNVRRALDWIEGPGDLDGDGLIEFSGTQQDQSHIAQQGWKDSHDSLHFADGREVVGPIALVEVQGYGYAAYRGLAEVARLRGDEAWADELSERADRIRQTVEDQFWLEDVGYYAQALDGEKRTVDAISSNPGHLLFCGLPSEERAARMAARLARPDLDSGWGLRTLSSEMTTYNPMSYHNGSIWPHDMSLAMAGLAGYGHRELATRFALSLVTLAAKAHDLRIAELYCGFPPSESVPEPVRYPVSCIPQAWAAGAGLLALRALLGLKPDPDAQSLVAEPCLPDDWDRLTVSGLRAYDASVAATAERIGDRFKASVTAG